MKTPRILAMTSLLAAILVAVPQLYGQDRSTLRAGRRVRLVHRAPHQVTPMTGTYLGITDDSITVLVEGKRERIPLSEVSYFEVRSRERWVSHLQGFGIGLLGGFALGLAVGYIHFETVCDGEPGLCGLGSGYAGLIAWGGSIVIGTFALPAIRVDRWHPVPHARLGVIPLRGGNSPVGLGISIVF